MPKHPVRFFAALLVVGLLAGACSNGSTNKNATGTSKPNGGLDNSGGLFPLSKVNKAQHDGTPKRGGTVKFGTESAVLSYSPNGNPIQPADLALVTSVFDSLTNYDAKGQVVGQLAKTIKGSDGFKTWTVTLKPDIKFSNDKPLNAGEIANHTEWLQASPSCSCATDAASITSLDMPDGPDGLTVVYHLDAANVAWPTKLSAALGWITESSARNSASDPNNPDIDHLIGAGAFSYKSKTNDLYTVVANPHYYGTDPLNDNAKLPYLDSIVFQPFADATTRVAGVQSNSIQIMQTADTSNLVTAKKDANLEIQPISGSSSTILVMNLTKPPFGVTPKAGQSDAEAAKAALTDPRARDAREAFMLGINRNEINQKYYQGTRIPAYGYFPPTDPYFDPKGQLPHYDPAKAKAMVAKLKKEGVKTRINTICIATPESSGVFAILQQQGKATGFDAHQKQVDQAILVQTLLLGKATTATADWNISCFRSGQLADPDGVFNGLSSTGTANLNHYQNDKVDAALKGGRTVEGLKARKPYYDTVQEQFAKDMVVTPLLYDYYGNVYRKDISGLSAPRADALGSIQLSGLYYKK